MKIYQWFFLIITVFIIFSLGTSQFSVADDINACGLVTKKEAQKAAGVKLAKGRLTDMAAVSGSTIMAGKTLCHFESLDRKNYKRFVSVDLSVKDTKAAASQYFKDFTAMIKSPEPVNEIGEKAIWGGVIKTPFGGLHVLKGKYYFIIKIDSGKEKNSFNQAKKLATAALKKL